MYNIDKLYGLSDLAIIAQLGNYIKQKRIEQQLTQQMVAAACRLDRVTLSEIENGRPCSILTVIKVLRVLNQLEQLGFIMDTNPLISPLLLQKLQGKQTKRVREKKILNS